MRLAEPILPRFGKKLCAFYNEKQAAVSHVTVGRVYFGPFRFGYFI